MGRRLAVMVGAACVGALFALGLFVHGRGGGLILLVVAAILGTLTYAIWHRLHRRRDLTVRLVILAVILALAIVKLVTG
jgi:hypothetical protein